MALHHERFKDFKTPNCKRHQVKISNIEDLYREAERCKEEFESFLENTLASIGINHKEWPSVRGVILRQR